MVNRHRRGPFARWPRAADAIVATGIFVAALFVIEGPNETLALRSLGDVPIGAFFLVGAASVALLWRRQRPLAVLAVTLIATNLAAVLGYSELIGLTLLIALYGVGRRVGNDRWSYAALGGTLALILGTAFVDEATAAETGFGLVVMSLIWYVGRRMRLRGERAAQLEREQAAEARRVVTDERTRIARELHDVVAHRVSLMTVQAGAARTVAADDPQGALRAMEAVEETGRQALDELRHLLGILRPEADPDGLGPQPGVADVPRLVRQLNDAGLDVSLELSDVPNDLPARVDLFVYRIVQEALTNVLKHAAAGARTKVRLSSNSKGLEIEVVDDGQSAGNLPGSGHGIVGMRERAQMLGGTLEAGPRPGGGFRVVAHLPIGEGPK